jgi:DNA-binding LacI/PurR family transcriptional regulator
MGRNGTTIVDVAERCGVSKVTVSYVLNGREGRIKISDATKNQVFAVAKELGYHPNALARGLARRKTDTLTVVMQYANVFSALSGFISELMRGASDKACELGYDLMLHTKRQSSLDAEVAALTDGRADGALLLRDVDDPLAGILAGRGFPCVQIFTHIPGSDLYAVDCDNVTGAERAVDYLIELGHRRIAHIGGSPNAGSASERRMGYHNAMSRAGLSVLPEWNMEIRQSTDDFAALVALMFGSSRPTALFCWSDDVAVQAMRVMRSALELDVPRDVSVIGFDSTPLCENTSPRLTSISQPVYDMAACGVDLLVKSICGEPAAQRQFIFPARLDIRASCAPFQGLQIEGT